MLKRKRKPDSMSESKGTASEKIKKRIKPIAALELILSVLIYGRSGTGKTSFAATMADIVPEGKKVLLIDVREQGQDSISEYGDRVDVFRADTWDDFVGAYWYLKEMEHPYGGVIIDTVTQVQSLAMQWAKQKAKSPEVMSRRAWGFLGSALSPVLLDYRDLPIHTCFLAQDRKSINDDTEEEMGDLLPDFGPAMMPSVAKDLNAMVKAIGQTHIKQREKKKDGKITKITEFRMRLGPHPVYLTKVRSPKGSKVPGFIVDPTFEKILKIMKGESV
jgi:energy-coupling factor transporter ATP-binding protein EcfA2